jgi:hypothetical protein
MSIQSPIMFRLGIRLLALAMSLIVLPWCMASEPASDAVVPLQGSAALATGKLSLAFERNLGQSGSDASFLARMPKYTVFLDAKQAAVVFQQRRKGESPTRLYTKPVENVSSAIRLSLLGTTPSSRAEGEDALTAKSNYFIGSDPALWFKNVPTYARVRYASIYKHVDMVYYGGDEHLEYDFIVHPGGNAREIKFSLLDGSSVHLEPSGDLLIQVGDSTIQLSKPVAYQVVSGHKTRIEACFHPLGNREYGFQVGSYDRGQDLIIDPELIFSTYLGGTSDEGVFGIAFDEEHNIYVAGETSSVDFPTRQPLQPQLGGNYDAFVSKFDPTGRKLIYSTYIGGSGYDHAVGLRVDSRGNAYIAGLTFSVDFPVKNALQAANAGQADGFLSKLNSSGSELVFSTYLGGSGFDQVNGLALGPEGSIYLAGFTSSGNFPTTPNAFGTKCDGGVQPYCAGDAFITKFDASGQKLAYSTLVGGSSSDAANGIAVDQRGNAYITGQTSSRDFPVHDPYQANLAGPGDAFVLKLDPSGSKSVWATFLGGSGFDVGTDIALDYHDNVYVTGTTNSSDFPLSHAFQASNKGGPSDGFVTKFNPQGVQLIYSTYIGGSGLDFPFRIAIDRNERPAIVGFTSSTDFPLQSPLQPSYAGGMTDAFVLQLHRNGEHLRFSTYLGGTGDEYGYAIAMGCDDNIWVGGSTSSTNFPLHRAFQPVYGGGPFDAFLSEIIPARAENDETFNVADGQSAEGGCHLWSR